MMTRKEFIQHCFTLGVGAPFLSMFLESCEKGADLYPEFEVNFSGKVIIIGAGAAGMTAGYLLNKYNIDFQIIEASSHYGGRVKRADNFADFPIDIGAEWIHEDPSVLTRLISDESVQGNIEIIPYSPETIYNWNNGKLKKQNWASNFYSEYKFKNTTWFGFFENYIVPGIEDKIMLNSPVTAIDHSGDKVIVTTENNGTFEADKVLVTVPLKILQKEMIDFNPEMPSEKQDAINSVVVPDGIKVFIEFSEKFYPDMLLIGGLISAAQSQEYLYYDAAFRKDAEKNVLGLFTVGDIATPLASLNSDDEIIEAVMNELDTIFDSKASETYIKHIIQNWSAEPYIQGSYSTVFNESEASTIEKLLQPLDDKVYFAGEAMSSDNGATVPGAAETAYAVIETILK